MDRLNKLVKQFESPKKSIQSQSVSSYVSSKDDEVVIVSGIRTAIGKAKRGSFKDTTAVQLLAPVLKHVVKDIDPTLVDDIVVGTVLAPGSLRASECRAAQFIAGIPHTACLRTVNRQCSSGLQAIADVASAIQSGFINIGIAAGVESMTSNQMSAKGYQIIDEMKANNDALNCLLPMGRTSENVAQKYNVTRLQQDTLAVLSNERAIKARQKFRDEILPIETMRVNEITGKKELITVRDDDGPRSGTSISSLAKLRTVFKKNGTTTAGNSSQVSDGACALLMMKRSKAKQLGLKIMGRMTNFAVSGVAPEVMGIGPAFAIPKVLKQAKLKASDVDLYEINEAFASQAVHCVRNLGLTMDNVNVNGGAIALGHPLGMTGARMTVTLLKEMERRGDKTGVVSMCIGTGMGAAAVFERD